VILFGALLAIGAWGFPLFTGKKQKKVAEERRFSAASGNDKGEGLQPR
jgi:hypothetical protein